MSTQIRRIRNRLQGYFIRHRQNENSILVDPAEIPDVLTRRIQTPAKHSLSLGNATSRNLEKMS